MKKTDGMPEWVYLALVGINSRGAAMVFFWLCIILALGALAASLIEPLALLGSALLPAALWYRFAIKWMDRHAQW